MTSGVLFYLRSSSTYRRNSEFFGLSVTADSSLRSPTGGVEVSYTTPHIYEHKTAQTMATSRTCLSTSRWPTPDTGVHMISHITQTWAPWVERSLIHTLSHRGSSHPARVTPYMHGHLRIVFLLCLSSPISFSSLFCRSSSRPSWSPSPLSSSRSSCPKTCATPARGPWAVMLTRHPRTPLKCRQITETL